MAGKINGSSFWHMRHIEPKRQFKWIAEIGNQEKIYSYVVKEVGKPTFQTAVGEHKILGHTFKYPGPVTWEDLELKVVDLAGSEDDPTRGNAALYLKDLIHASGYAYPEGQGGAVFGITKAKAVSALGKVRVYQLDSNGNALEEFEYHNPFISNIDFGNFSYDTEDMGEVTMTISYDWAEINQFGGPMFPKGSSYEEAKRKISQAEGLDGRVFPANSRPDK